MDIPQDLLADLKRLNEKLTGPDRAFSVKLAALLSHLEITACAKRLQALIKHPIFPNPGPGRHYPWPPV
jgi:hypothetical protein